jgi:hypothetical protein
MGTISLGRAPVNANDSVMQGAFAILGSWIVLTTVSPGRILRQVFDELLAGTFCIFSRREWPLKQMRLPIGDEKRITRDQIEE